MARERKSPRTRLSAGGTRGSCILPVMTTHDKFRGIPKWLLAIMLIVSAAIIYGVIDWIIDS